MPHKAEELLPAEVEPFPLSADVLHMTFHLQIWTLSKIPSGL